MADTSCSFTDVEEEENLCSMFVLFTHVGELGCYESMSEDIYFVWITLCCVTFGVALTMHMWNQGAWPWLITIYWQPVKFGLWQQCRRRQIKLENMSKGLWQCFWKTYLMDDPLTKYLKYPQGIRNTIFIYSSALFATAGTVSPLKLSAPVQPMIHNNHRSFSTKLLSK